MIGVGRGDGRARARGLGCSRSGGVTGRGEKGASQGLLFWNIDAPCASVGSGGARFARLVATCAVQIMDLRLRFRRLRDQRAQRDAVHDCGAWAWSSGCLLGSRLLARLGGCRVLPGVPVCWFLFRLACRFTHADSRTAGPRPPQPSCACCARTTLVDRVHTHPTCAHPTLVHALSHGSGADACLRKVHAYTHAFSSTDS